MTTPLEKMVVKIYNKKAGDAATEQLSSTTLAVRVSHRDINIADISRMEIVLYCHTRFYIRSMLTVC